MPLHMSNVNLLGNLKIQGVSGFNNIEVFDFSVGLLPAFCFPAISPFGDAINRVFGVTINGDALAFLYGGLSEHQ